MNQYAIIILWISASLRASATKHISQRNVLIACVKGRNAIQDTKSHADMEHFVEDNACEFKHDIKEPQNVNKELKKVSKNKVTKLSALVEKLKAEVLELEKEKKR